MSNRKFRNQSVELMVFVCLILVGFKLSGSIIAIDWSWWLVFSPLSVLLMNYLIIGCLVLYKLYNTMHKANNGSGKKRVYIE